MIRTLRNIILLLIILFAILTGYLTLIKPSDKRNSIIMDSFVVSSKALDTLIINTSIPVGEIKDILFTVQSFSDEYGGSGYLIRGIENGKSFLHRKIELKDSTLFIGTHKIKIGDTYEDVQQLRSWSNIFKIEKNRLSLKNEGFINTIKIIDYSSDQKISLIKPVLLINGNSWDSFYISRSLMTFYKSLPYILIILGLTYYILGLIQKIKIKINHNH